MVLKEFSAVQQVKLQLHQQRSNRNRNERKKDKSHSDFDLLFLPAVSAVVTAI